MTDFTTKNVFNVYYKHMISVKKKKQQINCSKRTGYPYMLSRKDITKTHSFKQKSKGKHSISPQQRKELFTTLIKYTPRIVYVYLVQADLLLYATTPSIHQIN